MMRERTRIGGIIMSNEKTFNNERQIAKSALKTKEGQFRLIDFVDNLDTIHQAKGVFNKKILININASKDGTTHKESYVAFYWDVEQALLIASDIINCRFKDMNYGAKENGIYTQYGGGQVSRILNIGYKNGRYMFQIATYKAVKTKTGAIMPDKSNPIDNHSIQLGEFEARRVMTMIYHHIQAKLVHMMNLQPNTSSTPEKPKFEAHTEVKQTPVKKEEPVITENEVDIFEGFDELFK